MKASKSLTLSYLVYFTFLIIIFSCSVGMVIYTRLANNKFYAGTLDGKLNAYDLSGTTPTWRHMNATSIFSSPLVESNTVYVGAGDRNFYALNADTGVLIWKYRTDGQIVSSACVVGVNNDVYYPNNLGYAN